MLKVVHLIHGLSMGGAETLVKDYALRIDKSKFDLSIICFCRYNLPWEKVLADAGIKVIYLSDYMPFYNCRNAAARAVNKLMRYLLTRKYIKSINPDVIHTHMTVNNYIKFASPHKGTKIIHMLHSQPKTFWDGSAKGNADFNAAKWLIKNYGMRFITLNEKMRNEVNEMFGVNDSIILNNGIDFSRFEKARDKNIVRNELNIPEDAFVVGHVGRFNPVKNHELLAKIFKEICGMRTNAFLLMVGVGELQNYIENQLREYGLSNKYLILSKRTDIPDILNAMDVFVFPSLFEGLGIALIEAQKMGLPCVISDKIPEAARISNLCTVKALNDPVTSWAEACITPHPQDVIYNNLEEWDMKNIVKRLEMLYEGKI